MSESVLGTEPVGDGGMSYTASDTDGDGYIDSYTADLDGDGFAESGSYDLDRDGYLETAIVVDAATGASVTSMDTDGDGVADTLLLDNDGDGYVDEAYVDASTSATSSHTDSAADPGSDTDTGPAVAPGLDSQDTSNPDLFIDSDELPEAGEEGIHGDPRADVEYHTVQPGPVDCLPTSVSMVISEVTGTSVSADELVALANEDGFMTSSGMSLEGSITLLQQYGVDAEIEYGDADYLRDALDAGDEVILAIDSADLYADGGGPFDPGMTSGHAVVLTGIDDGPPAYVYINDPAFADGAGVQVPLEEFLDAWEDSDNAAVSIPVGETVAAEPATATDEAAVSGDATASGSAPADEGSAVAADASSATAADESDSDAASDVASPKRILLLPITLLHAVAGWIADATQPS